MPASTTTPRLTLLDFGQIEMDRRVIMPAGGAGQWITIPVPGYLIRAGDATILVDSGMPRAVLTGHEDLGPWMRPRGGAGASATARLAELGLRPADLTCIIATHFHFDHGGGLPEFIGVPIVVQWAALEAARGGNARERGITGAPGLLWQPIEGDVELIPGVTLLATGGHTIGHQSVLVETAGDGPFLLAIDAIYSRDQLAADDWGAYADRDAARASARRVQTLAAERGATLVYGHDAAQWAELRRAPEWYG
jgi:N-acyl homoserine lactone hydrolase